MRTMHSAFTYPNAFRCFVLLLLTAALVAPASAQMTDHQWELGFAVGNANVASADEDFDLDLRLDLRAGYLLSDVFELELQVLHASAILDSQLRAAMLNGVFNFRPATAVVPYVLLGAGTSNVEDVSFLGLGSDLEEDAGAFQVGVGSRFFLGDEQRMALRFELSSLWIDTDLFENDRHTSLTAGLSWMLGER